MRRKSFEFFVFCRYNFHWYDMITKWVKSIWNSHGVVVFKWSGQLHQMGLKSSISSQI